MLHALKDTKIHGRVGRRLAQGMAATTLLLGLVAGPLMAGNAAAGLGLCRSDPIVRLSNHRVVQLTVTVSDDSADVQNVAYTLHVPANENVSGIVYTGGSLSKKESVTVVSDNAPNTYDSTTTVSTATPNAAVTAETRVPSVGSDSVSGYAGQDLKIHIVG